MEIFGIPITLVLSLVCLYLVYYTQEKQKEKKETTRKWNAIRVQMSKDEVIKELGNPHRVWQAGVAEIWCYGPNDSDGVIRFINGKVIAFQKPDRLKM